MSNSPLDAQELGKDTVVLHELFVNHIRAQLKASMADTRKKLIEEIDATIDDAVDSAVVQLQSDIETCFLVDKRQFVINLKVNRHE